MESEALVGSVHERAGGGGGSCGGDRGRTEGATGDTEMAPDRAALPAWSRGRGRARRFSVVDDITDRCGRFVNFLGPLLAHNCYYHHQKVQGRKIHTSFFELRLSFQHFNFRPLNTPRAATMTPMAAITSPL